MIGCSPLTTQPIERNASANSSFGVIAGPCGVGTFSGFQRLRFVMSAFGPAYQDFTALSHTAPAALAATRSP
jgi:hypothetical protein